MVSRERTLRTIWAGALLTFGVAGGCTNGPNTAGAGGVGGAAAGTTVGGAGGGRVGSGGAIGGAGGSDGGTADASRDGRAEGGRAGVDAGADAVVGACKRGIATNTAPGAAFLPAVSWWYNWSAGASGTRAGIEFVPMIWGSNALTAALPSTWRFLLGFNEPNFHAQSNLTAQQAAADWPMLVAKANAAGADLVSPAVNYCGPASACNGTSPYQYLRDFFAACPGCRVDHVAVHWYNCDLPSLVDYLEPGGGLEGFEQFGKPIWLTEFSCDGSASVASQEAFMRAAVPYLESNPHVFRYSWFSADPIPNGRLVNGDGSPTPLGQVYAGLPGACR